MKSSIVELSERAGKTYQAKCYCRWVTVVVYAGTTRSKYCLCACRVRSWEAFLWCVLHFPICWWSILCYHPSVTDLDAKRLAPSRTVLTVSSRHNRQMPPMNVDQQSNGIDGELMSSSSICFNIKWMILWFNIHNVFHERMRLIIWESFSQIIQQSQSGPGFHHCKSCEIFSFWKTTDQAIA